MAGVAEHSPPICEDKRSEILIEERVKAAQRHIKRAAKSAAACIRKQQDRDGGVTAPTETEMWSPRWCNQRQHDISAFGLFHGFRLGGNSTST
ncbi:hypothetical protein NL676_010845 [Syzygium grande]|nr:hypothetical protein NL676_010845 [Syzygium grande]